MEKNYTIEPFFSNIDEITLELSGEWEEKAKTLVKENPEKR